MYMRDVRVASSLRVPGGEPPASGGRALATVHALPIQRLALARAVDGGPARGAPPELVPPRLPPTAPRVRAQAHVGIAVAFSSCLGSGQRPPLHHEPTGSVFFFLAVSAVRVRRGDEELARGGVEQEAASGGGVAARAVAVLDAVAELAERRDVAEPRGARAQRHPRARVLVLLDSAAAVELHHGERVQRRRVPARRRARQQRRPRRPAPDAVEPHLAEETEE